MATTLCISQEPIIFTRYLYNKIDVKQSLLISLLNRNMDEALFWTYELYYSGFHVDTFEYIINIYREMYSLLNPKLVLFIEKLLVKWSNDKTLDWTIGSIIATLINREYNVNYFVQRYFGVKCNESTVNHNPLYKFLITLNENDIVKYKTIDTGYADTILNRGCKYAVHKEYNNLFEANVPSRETLREIYYYHWLYYCLDTPIWRQRIFTYKGRLNHDLKKVEFDDEDNLQGFYDKWGYYPDEQPVAVGKNVFGCSIDDRQLNVMEFCTRYNATPIMKKVKTGDRHLGTTQNDDDIDMPLTNSIRFKS
jgi:hypothetical protein